MASSLPPRKTVEGIAAVFVVIAGAAAALVAFRIDERDSTSIDFWPVERLRRHVFLDEGWNEFYAAMQSIDLWREDQVEDIVRTYVFEGGGVQLEAGLLAAFERTRQPLLEILSHNTTSEEFVTSRLGHAAPLCRACRILPKDGRSLVAIPLLLPYLTVEDEYARANVIDVIIRTGHEDCLAAVKACHDSNACWRMTLRALNTRAWQRKLPPEIEAYAWPFLKEFVRSTMMTELAAAVMLRVNDQRATPFLTGPDLFDFGKPQFGEILSAYCEVDSVIDRTLLLSLIARAEANSDEGHAWFSYRGDRSYYYRTLGTLLARLRHQEDSGVIARLMNHDE
jgi:hypothetical protein